MMFVSTRERAPAVTFHDALMTGLAPDGGLYVPTSFPMLDPTISTQLQHKSLLQLGEIIMSAYLPEIAPATMQQIIASALNFPIPLVKLESDLYLLEVFHGPTLAFKDVGARFMANVMSYYLQQEQKQLTIVVATSGDTGSAIGHAFHRIPNTAVYVLYPSKKITHLQEQQMTTLGDNIHALEVVGTFDDCQALVKSALLDQQLSQKYLITTANSINISRLLPQMIYHTWGVSQLQQQGEMRKPVLSVPSGNLGNLTAALYAKKIGVPIATFIAATNVNSVFPDYLASGQFRPQASLHSYSNAMDVGNPSNFERLASFYAGNHNTMQQEMNGISISDEDTLATIRRTYEKTGYILDPHTAVGVAAATLTRPRAPVIVTATAHPAKFPEVIQRALNFDIELPASLQLALNKPKQATKISNKYAELQHLLLK